MHVKLGIVPALTRRATKNELIAALLEIQRRSESDFPRIDLVEAAQDLHARIDPAELAGRFGVSDWH